MKGTLRNLLLCVVPVVCMAVAGNAGLDSALGKPFAAFAGALLTLVLLLLARVGGRTEPTALLLVGVILNAFFSAVIPSILSAHIRQ